MKRGGEKSKDGAKSLDEAEFGYAEGLRMLTSTNII